MSANCLLPVEIWCIIANYLCTNRDYCALSRVCWQLHNALGGHLWVHKSRFTPTIAKINAIKYNIIKYDGFRHTLKGCFCNDIIAARGDSIILDNCFSLMFENIKSRVIFCRSTNVYGGTTYTKTSTSAYGETTCVEFRNHAVEN